MGQFAVDGDGVGLTADQWTIAQGDLALMVAVDHGADDRLIGARHPVRHFNRIVVAPHAQVIDVEPGAAAGQALGYRHDVGTADCLGWRYARSLDRRPDHHSRMFHWIWSPGGRVFV